MEELFSASVSGCLGNKWKAGVKSWEEFVVLASWSKLRPFHLLQNPIIFHPSLALFQFSI